MEMGLVLFVYFLSAITQTNKQTSKRYTSSRSTYNAILTIDKAAHNYALICKIYKSSFV